MMIFLPLAILAASATGWTAHETGKVQSRQSSVEADVPGLVYGRLNEDIRIGRVVVRPLAVIRDSRCPMGWNPRRKMFCAWQGDFAVRVRVSGVRGEREITTQTGLALRGGRRLELIDVRPRPPFTDGSPESHRFGFRIR